MLASHTLLTRSWISVQRLKDLETNFEMQLKISSTVDLVPDEQSIGISIPRAFRQV